MSRQVALALVSYLEEALRRGGGRHFYRIEGFDDNSYGYLLALIAKGGDTLGGRSLWVKTIAPVEGGESYLIESGKSATWYRNHVPETHALVLIFNRRTSDAQSLKDIHPITEQLLSHQTSHLARATFSSYQPSSDELRVLDSFIKRLPKLGIPTPQLRDLIAFYGAVDAFLGANPGKGLAHALAASLPELNLFAARELADIINTRKGDNLLKLIHRSSLVGTNPLDGSDLARYLGRLEATTFENQLAYGGQSAEMKRDLLRRFLSEVMDDRTDLNCVFKIDWLEVSPVLYKERKIPQPERYKALALDLSEVIAAEKITDLSESAEDALAALRKGERPDDGAVDDIYEEMRAHLSETTAKQLSRLRRVTKRSTDEFSEGLLSLLVDLFDRHGEAGQDLAVGVTFTEASIPKRISEGEKSTVLREAVRTFQTLYRGLEEYLSEVRFDFGMLWSLLDAEGDDVTDKLRQAELTFKVELIDEKGQTVAEADLVWQYTSDNTLALTAAHLAAEGKRLLTGPSLPIYNSVRLVSAAHAVDLSQPFETLGTWYEQPGTVREKLTKQLKPKILTTIWQRVSKDLSVLENAWQAFINRANEEGLLRAGIYNFLEAYETFLHKAFITLTTDTEASNGFSAIGQSWIVGEEHLEHWAVVPLLHPLKLHWWVERLRVFDGFVQKLRAGGSGVIADEKEFKRSLGTLYGSSNYPAVLALQKSDLTAEYLLPVVESHGYELFRPKHLAGLAFGLTEKFVSVGEGELAAKVASKELSKILSDYLKTFPFARDGFDIYLFKCRSSSLPGLLVDALAKAEHELPRVNVVVHVDDSGAPAYREVLRWLEQHEAYKTRDSDAYFPAVTLKVLECSTEKFFDHVTDFDLVILADVLAGQGQNIEPHVWDSDAVRRPFEGYFRVHGGSFIPHSRGQQTREIVLNDGLEPSLTQNFYKVQWITKERRPLKSSQAVSFNKHVTLQSWAKPLGDLHDHFNWVTCYDTTIDRFLLKATIPQSVEVIRYSVGLGTKRRHNLTVSSSDEAQQTVIHRLGARLDPMVGMPHAYRQKLARRLVEEAKKISGDIVLRAAGPGAFLNELIGVVTAKHLTEQEQDAAAVTCWVYLDDFAHWFPKKFPDLLFFALRMGKEGRLSVDLSVIEVKCVDEGGFEVEAQDARRQVVAGVDRLKRVWTPGGVHIDARYWYDQLYQAIISNLSFAEQVRLPWDAVQQNLLDGDFHLNVTGETFVFCYSGSPPSLPPGRLGECGAFRASTLPGMPLTYHHYGRAGLLEVLSETVGGRESLVPQPPPLIQAAVPAPEAECAATEVPHQKNATAGKPPPVGGPTPSNATSEQDGVLNKAEAEALEDTGPPDWLIEQANDLAIAISDYEVDIYPIEAELADIGPNVVRHKIMLRPGERLTKLQGIAPDLVHRLALTSIPLIDNVLGTQYVGIDLANPEPQTIQLMPLLERLTPPGPGELPFILGQAPDGRLFIDDLSEFPHLLVAGATNSGKSVFLRSLVVSFIKQYTPDQLKLLIIDPKRTDFSFFEGLPHLTDQKVVTDREEARDRLLSLVHEEMPRRQRVMQGRSMKIKDFNRRFPEEALPVIVAVIDEYAQLLSIMSSREGKAFEQDLMSLAAVARSTGVHLVLATQRPSADVVTGTLRANLPASVAFKVASGTNSRIVLDQGGAENLLGKGDMLFRRPSGEIIRLQAPFIDEVELYALIERYRSTA